MLMECPQHAAALKPILVHIQSEYNKILEAVIAANSGIDYSQFCNQVSSRQLKDFFNSDEQRALELSLDKRGRLAIQKELHVIDVDQDTIKRARTSWLGDIGYYQKEKHPKKSKLQNYILQKCLKNLILERHMCNK